MVKENFFERNPTFTLFLWLVIMIVMSIAISEYYKGDSSLSQI